MGGDLPFLDYPVGILVEDQEVLVSDWGNNRLLSLTGEGEIQKSLTGLRSPAGLGRDEDRERIYIVEQKANQVRIIHRNDFSTVGFLQAKAPLEEPRGVWVDEGGRYM